MNLAIIHFDVIHIKLKSHSKCFPNPNPKKEFYLDCEIYDIKIAKLYFYHKRKKYSKNHLLFT